MRFNYHVSLLNSGANNSFAATKYYATAMAIVHQALLLGDSVSLYEFKSGEWVKVRDFTPQNSMETVKSLLNL